MVSKKIQQFLNSWKEGVIAIGKVYINGGDYKKYAQEFISSHYAFSTEKVLFKPTFTKTKIFRNAQDEALSYFVKGDCEEDHGFALKPWEAITLKELNTIEENELIVAMGTLSFKPINPDQTTLVAFTFLLIDIDDALKIKVHHSSPVL